MERGKVAVLCMDLLACSLEYCHLLTHLLSCPTSLSPCLLLFQCWSGSRLLQHSTLWFITSWLQHRRHLKDGLSNLNSLLLKHEAFILDLFTLRHFRTEYHSNGMVTHFINTHFSTGQLKLLEPCLVIQDRFCNNRGTGVR